MQAEFLKRYREKYPPVKPSPEGMRPDREERYVSPPGFDAHREHHRVFYEAVRSRKRPIEDAVFVLRAAGPALLANTSYFERRICRWDADQMQEA